MSRLLFLNLPVADLSASREFFAGSASSSTRSSATTAPSA